jgi:TonB family protein
VFGALAALYNPIVLVHLNRSTWISVNWFTVGVIIVAAVAFLPRHAQIWIGAAGLILVIIAGLLWGVAWVQTSVSSARRQSAVSTNPRRNWWDKDPIASNASPQSIEKEYSPPLAGETTWQWLQRNDMHGLPGHYNMEFEPSEPLVTSHPFAEPKSGDPLYDAGKESDLGKEQSEGGRLARIYRRGVFAGYNVIKKVGTEAFEPDKYLAIPRAIPRALPVAPTATTSPPLSDPQSGNVFDQFDAAPIATTPVPASPVTASPPSDSTQQRLAEKPKIVYAPHPSYPPKADKTGVTGSGRFKITFDERGNTKAVEIVQSTGDGVLDSNTIKTLKLWRAAPGSSATIVVPIDYRQKRQSHPKPKAGTAKRNEYPNYYSQPPSMINPSTPR